MQRRNWNQGDWLRNFIEEVPGWLGWLGDQLLISAEVMISRVVRSSPMWVPC